MSPDTYTQLINMKSWADQDLCDAAVRYSDTLSDDDNILMRRVLDHMHAVDKIFRHHLLGTAHGFKSAGSEVTPELQTLVSGIREVDAWYATYVDGLSARDLEQPVDFVFTSGKRARMRRAEIILHVSLHGTYHRGNAGALLQLRGLKPSRDGITNYLEDAALAAA